MTRDEFFGDLAKAFRILRELGVPELAGDVDAMVASMKAGGRRVTPQDLRRYADKIDWAAQNDARSLGELAQVLLRLLSGLATELESFRRARDEK